MIGSLTGTQNLLCRRMECVSHPRQICKRKCGLTTQTDRILEWLDDPQGQNFGWYNSPSADSQENLACPDSKQRQGSERDGEPQHGAVSHRPQCRNWTVGCGVRTAGDWKQK